MITISFVPLGCYSNRGGSQQKTLHMREACERGGREMSEMSERTKQRSE